MKTIKEIQEEPSQELSLNKEIYKKSESSQKEIDIENQKLTMDSDINKLSIISETSKQLIKKDNEIISSSKDKEEIISQIEKEKSNEIENEIQKTHQKKNLVFTIKYKKSKHKTKNN